MKKEQAMKDKMLFLHSEIEKASSSKKDKNLKIAGYANTTSAINAVDFKMTSGNIDSGVIKMYGVSKS